VAPGMLVLGSAHAALTVLRRHEIVWVSSGMAGDFNMVLDGVRVVGIFGSDI
jgi:hypothetical protein